MKQMSVNKKSIIQMSLGTLLIACAFALAINNWNIERKAGNGSKTIIAQMDQQIASNGSDLKELNKEAQHITIDGVLYDGFLVVPQFDLELPVAAEWSFEQLLVSPSAYSGNRQDDNWVIAGHNYKSHFLPLKSLQVGDAIYFVDAVGEKTSYEVIKTEILDPIQVDEMTDSGYALSLFTCTYDGTSRFTVRCQKI